VRLSDEGFNWLSQPSRTGIEYGNHAKKYNKAQRILGRYFMQVASMQRLARVRTLVPEYKEAIGDEERRAAAIPLLAEGLRVALEPLQPQLTNLRRRGYMRAGVEDASAEIWKLVLPVSLDATLPLLDKRFGIALPAKVGTNG